MSTGVENLRRASGADVVPVLASAARNNAATLEKEMSWFAEVLRTRISLYFEQPCERLSINEIAPPELSGQDSEYARLVRECAMTFDERIVLILALIPHLQPQVLDTLFISNKNLERGFTEFGGWRGKAHGGFLPTCETAAFILAGHDLARRFEIARLFGAEHFFRARDILRIHHEGHGEPQFSGALLISTEYVSRLTCGSVHKPNHGPGFPASLITTQLQWSDLVLAPQVLQELESINTWMKHSDTIMRGWGLGRTLKPGYRSLFYGPPGTGKTLAATLIGQVAGAEVYRIDLSMVVSKYIGETEKNLATVFDQAQNRRWILFFDEADALFGRRTTMSSAHDRYANQETSYLLQRVEDYPGIVILASNLKGNIDEAFARRFQSLVYFPMPDAHQRRRLWEGMLGPGQPVGADVDLTKLAEDHELSGGAIANVVRYGAISALQRNKEKIGAADLLTGIAKELRKEGKTV
jgi:hypothetical protein